MTKQLTTQNATITTTAVEVKTLTISGRQVTLAVFRQLREKPLINDNGTLNGVPWGTVNYHPDRCGDEREHWHVVWQQGSELLRSRVEEKPDFDFTSLSGSRLPAHWHVGEAPDRYLATLVYMGLVAGGDSVLARNHRPGGVYWTEATPDSFAAKLVIPAPLAGTDIFPVQGTASQAAVEAANQAERLRAARYAAGKELTVAELSRSAEWRETYTANRQYALDEAERKHTAAMAALLALIEEWGGFDAVVEAYTAEIEAEEARRRQLRAAHAAVADLPQLFIAV